MKALIQRVTRASVTVDGEVIARIGPGMLVLLGVEAEDTEASAEVLLDRVLNYRLFDDGTGRMNHSIETVDQELLLVSQFTLVADTRKGRRPGFSRAASPALAERLYDHVCERAKAKRPHRVASGRFAADMAVELVNDGPVTFLLETDRIS